MNDGRTIVFFFLTCRCFISFVLFCRPFLKSRDKDWVGNVTFGTLHLILIGNANMDSLDVALGFSTSGIPQHRDGVLSVGYVKKQAAYFTIRRQC